MLPFICHDSNHDDEADLTRREIMELAQRTSVQSLARPGPANLTGLV